MTPARLSLPKSLRMLTLAVAVAGATASLPAWADEYTDVSILLRSGKFSEALTKAGLLLSGTSPDGKLVEMVELPGHPYFVGCQFHPEFKSRPMAPHPLFRQFIAATLQHKKRAADPADRHGEPRDPDHHRSSPPLTH